MSSETVVTCDSTQQEKQSPFTEGGTCDDEIELVFDDQKKLFASKNFLRYASPVFEAMFSHDFKEKKQNYVKMVGKKYHEILDFLLCIHPRIQKSITEENVLRVVTIAEEYQVTAVISKCKELMESWLLNSAKQAQSMGYYQYQSEPLRHCIHIVTKAAELNYDDVVSSGVKTVAKFGHILYNQNQKKPFIYNAPSSSTTINAGDETLGEIQEDCKRLFNELPAEIRYRIVSERLRFWNEMDFK